MGAHHGPKKGRISIDDETRARIARALREGLTKTKISERFGLRLERIAEIAFEEGLGPEPTRRTAESIERMTRLAEAKRALEAVRGDAVDELTLPVMRTLRGER